MKESVKKVYQCDHCKRNMFVKSACEKHEIWCNKNPENISACEGCIHLVEIKVEYYFDTYNGESSRETKGFKCNKKEIELYPLLAARKGLPGKYPETFYGKELMPNKCELFNDGFNF